jgi:hypothetical protein
MLKFVTRMDPKSSATTADLIAAGLVSSLALGADLLNPEDADLRCAKACDDGVIEAMLGIMNRLGDQSPEGPYNDSDRHASAESVLNTTIRALDRLICEDELGIADASKRRERLGSLRAISAYGAALSAHFR